MFASYVAVGEGDGMEAGIQRPDLLSKVYRVCPSQPRAAHSSRPGLQAAHSHVHVSSFERACLIESMPHLALSSEGEEGEKTRSLPTGPAHEARDRVEPASAKAVAKGVDPGELVSSCSCSTSTRS